MSALATIVNYKVDGDFVIKITSNSHVPEILLRYDLENFNLAVDTEAKTLSLGGLLEGYVDSIGGKSLGNKSLFSSSVGLNFTYSGIDTGIDPNTGLPFAAIAREGSSGKGEGTVSLPSLSFFPFGAQFTLDFAPKFADIQGDPNNNPYGVLVNSGAFSMSLGELISGQGELFKGWLMASPFAIHGKHFNATADFHATVRRHPPTDIPEPMTCTLFGAGLAGLALRRRKSAA